MVQALKDYDVSADLFVDGVPPCPCHGTLRSETLLLLFCEFCKFFHRAISISYNQFKVAGYIIDGRAIPDYLIAQMDVCADRVRDLRRQRRAEQLSL
jgi:hypothetical protein